MRTKAPVKTNPISMLKNDHTMVKHLFEKYERAKDEDTKKQIAEEAITALKTHASLEEEIFYPAVRAQIEDDELMNEAEEEHHVVKILIGELEQLDASDPKYEAKFMVLAESVRHHIKEEEGEMLPKVKKSDVDLDAIGTQMLERREVLEGSE